MLLLARERGYRDGWTRPQIGVVLGGLVVASLVRSLATVLFGAWQTEGWAWDAGPLSGSLAALAITLVLGVVMVASAQLSRKRIDANAGLLAEQARLRALVESADLELVRSEAELRGRARVLLEPTINEIRELISEEISEADARQLSDRINGVVNDVVRPAAREFARSPRIDPRTVNAIRHGKATVVDIRICIVGDLVEVRIGDTGDGVSEGALAGLGTQMLDETCFRWELAQRSGGGSELIALLA